VAGTVAAETSVVAVGAQGGATGWKELTVNLTCGSVYWFSVCAQGTGASLPSVETAGSAGRDSFMVGGLGAALSTLGWAAGHGPVAATVANTSGTLASTAAPTGVGVNQLGGGVPVIVVRRGS
jgi:hypothetical protein